MNPDFHLLCAVNKKYQLFLFATQVRRKSKTLQWKKRNFCMHIILGNVSDVKVPYDPTCRGRFLVMQKPLCRCCHQLLFVDECYVSKC